MPRKSTLSAHPLAAVRRHFGLHQETLAAYLSMTPAQVGHLEAGRRTIGTDTTKRLLPLLQALVAPPEAADPAAHLALPDPAPLAARLDYCQHHAAKLRRELSALTQKMTHARRWQQALPTLLPTADERARPWLLRRQAQATADLDGAEAARYHLLRLRAEALEAEAAGLAALLGGAGPSSK